MWVDSEEEMNKNMDQTSVEGSKKPKRQMKTPFQLEVLEKTYATDPHPSEAIRAELSKKLNLTDRQLHMWFCHRRLKDKKDAAGMKPGMRRGLTESSRDELMVSERGSGHGSGSVSRSGSGSESGSAASASSEYDDEEYMQRRYFESPRTIVEHSVIVCVEAQLGEPVREDGPILGVEFDEPPPGAFGTPAVLTEQKDRYRHSYDSKLNGQCDVKHIKSAAAGPPEAVESKGRSNTNRHAAPSCLYKSTMHGNRHVPCEYGVEDQILGTDVRSQPARRVQLSSSSSRLNLITHSKNNLHMDRKRKSDDTQIGREVQGHEKKIRKEPEKQDLISRKREEQMRKEMERQDRERRKEEQRMIREQEKFEREERREMERREKCMQKELLKEEKRKQKEECRKEKEASRQKAAVERATARRIARESMELMEDERLELMELAASSKGLSSIVSLDYDTLQNLESFREALSEFPPKFVQLRMPFAIQPWIDSEENVADLLMVWKFCVTFADVLGLWPCTLDEFAQAFHDYDSRLLGEIHIALLKLIIKDIEDIVRMPSGGPGTNQYTAVNREGGHPHIVEGAYLWGFDICNWQKHLNPLTWPEILRQFFLSAGFGPQLKKQGVDRVCANNNDECKGSEDIVSTLRNGSAAEKAVTIMQEKGFNLLSRSRHRLTPGTVKFAAYHVLAFEGSKGLNVIQLAEKIQKSGLRDLTRSKTPEASISVALSRDPILFERIAPCTYCVRPAFRKDPAEAESIIAAAKEKIQRYANGLLAGQKEGEEERDDDSDSDVAEGAEVVPATQSDGNRNNECNKVGSFPGNDKGNIPNGTDLQNGIVGVDIVESDPDQDAEIDERRSGEPWVQGLTEGEYSDLSVEERLKALVTLIGIANEGNSIRVILEDRQDAANALMKQMLTEAQLDKRQMREEINAKLYNSYSNAIADGGPSPLSVTENKFCVPSTTTSGKNEPSVAAEHVSSVDNPVEYTSMNQLISRVQQNGYATERSHLQLKSYICHRVEEIYAYRSLPLGQDRRRNSYWMFAASASSHDPGLGRIFVESPNGYWKLIDSVEAFDALLTSLDTRGIRESHLHIMLKKIEHCFKDCLRRIQLFPNVLDQNTGKGRKEMLDVNSSHSCASVERSSIAACSSNPDLREPSISFQIELGQNEAEKSNFLKRYEDLQIWIWKECFNSPVLCGMGYGKKRCLPLLGICDMCLYTYDAKIELCPSCHLIHGKVGDEGNFLKQFNRERKSIDGTAAIISNSSPLRIRLIKALLTLLEVLVPKEALHASWTEDCRKAWGLKLQNSSSSEDLLQILIQFEGAIKRDYISAAFETTKELLSYCMSSRGAAYGLESVTQLPWIPKTTAAVSLRLLELDASISYTLNQKDESPNEKKVGALPNFTSRHVHTNDVQKAESMKSNRDRSAKEKNLNHLHDTPGVSGYGKVVCGRRSGSPGRKSQKRNVGLISKTGRRSGIQPKSSTKIPLQQGVRTQGQKQGKGRRTLRKRRTQQKAVIEETLRDYLRNKSNFKNVMKKPRSSGRQELRNTEVENDIDGHDATPDRSNKMMEMSEDDDDDDDDDNQIVGENGYDEEDGEDLEKDTEINDDDPGSESSVSGDYSD